ncbi:hypothetical protein N7507_009696 [Penicillium longicatenatum]|nr:hypothetical protein N7507_009696 [Penicillium longicatenatum]
MSGGQRQRIAIARAAYARIKLAIFDDSLSALDTSTSALVFTRHGTAVILATHDWNYLTDADNVIVIGDGRIREQGPPLGLKILKPHKLEAAKANLVTTPSRNIASLDGKSAKNQGDFRDYVYYFRASSGWSMILYAGALTVGVFCAQFTTLDLWVQWWAEQNAQVPFGRLAQYISVYAILAIVGARIWAFCMWLVFCHIVPTSSCRIHEYLCLPSTGSKGSTFAHHGSFAI